MAGVDAGEWAAVSGGRGVGDAEVVPDDGDFAFVAGDALRDADHEPAQFGNLVGEAVEPLALSVESLVDVFQNRSFMSFS